MDQPTRLRLSLMLLTALAAAQAALHAHAEAPVTQVTGSGDLAARVTKLEQIMNNRGLLDLLNRVDSLQQAVRRLRGDLEVQGHELDQLKKRQHELSVDIDQRLQRIEAAQGGHAAAPAAAQPAGSAAAAAPGAASANPPLSQLGGNSGAPPSAGSAAPPLTVKVVTPQPASTAAAPQAQANVQQPAGAPAPAAPPGAASTPAAPGAQPAQVAQAAPAAPGAATAAPAAAADAAQAAAAYTQAFDLLKGGRYDQAVKAFQQYLTQYPSGADADNAQYWLAETYYVLRQFKDAIDAYEALVKNYPQSQKVTQALLKIGYCYDELGQEDKARSVLDDLRTHYPGTTAARLAEERLQRLKPPPQSQQQ